MLAVCPSCLNAEAGDPGTQAPLGELGLLAEGQTDGRSAP